MRKASEFFVVWFDELVWTLFAVIAIAILAELAGWIVAVPSAWVVLLVSAVASGIFAARQVLRDEIARRRLVHAMQKMKEVVQ